MAYNEFQKERIERIFKDLKTPFDIRNMMGKACFFVDEKFCIGVDIDKETGKDRLMARIGEGQMADALLNSECQPMTSSEKIMTGYVLINADGFDLDSDLEHWVQLTINFNPLAKSKKRKKS